LEDVKPSANNVFLLGAGFTRAIFPKEPLKAPLNKDLLPIICKNAPSITTTLKEYYKELNKTNDIKILLTRLDLEIQIPKAKRQTALKTVRKTIEQQLAEYLQQFRFGERFKEAKDLQKDENRWLESLAKELFKENDAIITLNYDCSLEGLLDYYEVWSPGRGYAVVETTGIETSVQAMPNPKNILIYKIHGSENLVISPSLPNRNKTGIAFLINESIYPKSGKCSKLRFGIPGESYSYIIAPSFVKIPHSQIEVMMVETLCAAAKAKNFIIIGCGLRPEDSFLWLLLASFLKNTTRVNIQQSNYPGQGDRKKLFVEDLYAEKIAEKIRNHCTDVDEFVEVKSFSNGLEKDVHQLIDILKPKTRNT